jgi:toxin YoeB
MAKREIVWSNKARNDLFQILEYFILRNGSKNYSIKLNKSINKTIRLIAKYPAIGFKTDMDTIRAIVEGNYIIFYRIHDSHLEIITIWDTRNDPDKIDISQ